MEVKGIAELPPELLEKIIASSTLNDKLNLRASCHRLHDYFTKKLPDLRKPEECTIKSVILSKLKNSLHVRVDIDDVGTAQHFHALGQRASNCWKRKYPRRKSMECFFTFPIEGDKDFALLEKANIAHLQMDKRIPFHLTKTNMNWLKTLLRGCTIDKMSLLFEAMTLPQLQSVPALVSLVKAKHVEFVVQNSADIGKHAIAPAMRKIASNLALLDLREVTITADTQYGRTLGEKTKNVSVDLDLIGSFLKAGITRVTFDADFDCNEQMRKKKYERFLEKVTKSRQSVAIRIRSEHLPSCRDGQTFQASRDHPVYVTKVQLHDPSVRGKDELFITLQ